MPPQQSNSAVRDRSNRENALRAKVFRLESGHCSMQSALRICANTHLKGPELGQTIPTSECSCNNRKGLSSLVRRSGLVSVDARWSACLDIDCLGDLRRLGGLLDREMQHALVEMRVDGSVFRLERQRHGSVE